jgi:hypothetical protein
MEDCISFKNENKLIRACSEESNRYTVGLFNVSWPCVACTFLNNESDYLCKVCLTICEPDSVQNLRSKRHIVLIDLDNFGGFFNQLPPRYIFPEKTFFHGFFGGAVEWKQERYFHIEAFQYLIRNNCFKLHPMCLGGKNASDFAITLQIGLEHRSLPGHIPFTIVSGDKDFKQVVKCLEDEDRVVTHVDPHRDKEGWISTLISLADN